MPTIEEKKKLFNLKMGRFKGPSHLLEQYMDELEMFSHSDVEKLCQIIMKQCILEGKKIYSKKDLEYAVQKQKSNVLLRKTQY